MKKEANMLFVILLLSGCSTNPYAGAEGATDGTTYASIFIEWACSAADRCYSETEDECVSSTHVYYDGLDEFCVDGRTADECVEWMNSHPRDECDIYRHDCDPLAIEADCQE